MKLTTTDTSNYLLSMLPTKHPDVDLLGLTPNSVTGRCYVLPF